MISMVDTSSSAPGHVVLVDSSTGELALALQNHGWLVPTCADIADLERAPFEVFLREWPSIMAPRKRFAEPER
jgi:hypothetical protein